MCNFAFGASDLSTETANDDDKSYVCTTCDAKGLGNVLKIASKALFVGVPHIFVVDKHKQFVQ